MAAADRPGDPAVRGPSPAGPIPPAPAPPRRSAPPSGPAPSGPRSSRSTPPRPVPLRADRPQAGQPPPDDTPTRALPDGRHHRPRPTREQVLARVRKQLPFLVVMLLVALAFWRVALHHWREGAAEIGVALLLAAVLRARTSRETAGLLAVRGKRVDVVTYAVAGAVLVLVALTITGGPLASR